MSSVITSPPSSQTHYKLIYDHNQIKEFAKVFCGDLATESNPHIVNDKVQIMMLLAREKWLSKSKSSSCDSSGDSDLLTHQDNKENEYTFSHANVHLPRILVTHNDPNQLVRLVQRYEIPLDGYIHYVKSKLNIDGKDIEVEKEESIPNQSLAVYFNINVKSTLTGFDKLQKKIQEAFIESVKNHNNDSYNSISSSSSTSLSSSSSSSPPLPRILTSLNRIQSLLLSNIDKSNCNGKTFIDLDVDTKEKSWLDILFKTLFPHIQHSIIKIIETHGGYHVICKKTLLNWIQIDHINKFMKSYDLKFESVDRAGKKCMKTWMSVASDALIPLPGCLQGGFPVRMWNVEDWLKTHNLDLSS